MPSLMGRKLIKLLISFFFWTILLSTFSHIHIKKCVVFGCLVNLSAYLCTNFNHVHFAIPIWKCATHKGISFLRWLMANWYHSYFAFISNDRSAYLMHKVHSSAFSYYSYLEVCYPLLYFLFKIIHNWQPFINFLHLEW